MVKERVGREEPEVTSPQEVVGKVAGSSLEWVPQVPSTRGILRLHLKELMKTVFLSALY